MDEKPIGIWLKTSGFPESIGEEFKKYDVWAVKDFREVSPMEFAVMLEAIIQTASFESHFDLIIPFKSAVTDAYIVKRQEAMGMTNQQRALTMIDINRREMFQNAEVGALLREKQGTLTGAKLVKDGDVDENEAVVTDATKAVAEEAVDYPPLPRSKEPQTEARRKTQTTARRSRPASAYARRSAPITAAANTENVSVNIVESSEVESWVVWKAAYCTFCRLMDSPNLPKEHIEIDNEKHQSQWRRFSGKVEVNDPLNLWAVSYHPSQPKIAIYKSYKKICNTIYNKYDPDQLMAKALKAHRISSEYYIPSTSAPKKKESTTRNAEATTRRAETTQAQKTVKVGTWDYQYDYRPYYDNNQYNNYQNQGRKEQNRAWTTDRIKDWYRTNNEGYGYKASRSSYNKYDSGRYQSGSRNTDRISRTASHQSYFYPKQTANQWYNYPDPNAANNERKKKVKRERKPELYTQETWRGHYVWKKNDVECGADWQAVEAFIPRIRAQRKKSEYAKSEYLLCWERLKHNENAAEVDQPQLWVKAFNYLFYYCLDDSGLDHKEQVIINTNMQSHDLRMHIFKSLSKNGLKKTMDLYKKMEMEKVLRMAPKVSDLQLKSTSLRVAEHGVKNKTNGADKGVEEPVVVSPKAAEVSSEMLMGK